MKMADRIKQILNRNGGMWLLRGLVIIIFTLLSWNVTRLVDKVDALETTTIKKIDFCEVKTDMKDIQKTLNRELPKISMFMGRVEEYMRTHTP